MDETERANVWKEKSFEEMKKKERMSEKMKMSHGQETEASSFPNPPQKNSQGC
jgi:pyruvate dehydrogenase complex dehydrogenase (E1) component